MCCQSRRLSGRLKNSLYVYSGSPGLEVHMETKCRGSRGLEGNIFESLSSEVVVRLSTRLLRRLGLCAQKLTSLLCSVALSSVNIRKKTYHPMFLLLSCCFNCLHIVIRLSSELQANLTMLFVGFCVNNISLLLFLRSRRQKASDN